MPPTATATARPQSANLTFQGQTVPAESVDPVAFFSATRRRTSADFRRAYSGLGTTDTFELKKADILSAIRLRFSGTLTVVHGTGTAAATMRWPYDLAKNVRFTANGASNLINVSGLKLKFRELAKNNDLSDRGVVQSVNNANVQQGTLSQASEAWGVGPGQTAIASGAYPVELEWVIPISEDEKDLTGAVFLQTSAMDLNVNVDWNTLGSLFTITGNDTVALAGTVETEVERYSIPVLGDRFVVPDLSLFHSLVQSTLGVGLATGDNEIRLIGQGQGKTLLRLFYQVWAGAAPAVPLVMSDANFGPQAWRYGSNETPEQFSGGRAMRQWTERLYSSDVGGIWGFGCHEFETIWAFKDTVDMGQTSELRALINLAGVPVTPSLEYVQETMFSAGTAA